MKLSYFGAMLMFEIFHVLGGNAKKRNSLENLPSNVFVLPVLECLVGRMDETLCLLLSEGRS